jgi:hypothetical protein
MFLHLLLTRNYPHLAFNWSAHPIIRLLQQYVSMTETPTWPAAVRLLNPTGTAALCRVGEQTPTDAN